MSERRHESRYLCADMVRLEWLKSRANGERGNGEDEFVTEEGILEDISEAGGCVQIENPIPLGSPITLSIHNTTFTGNVCYCFYRDYGYFVGIRFSDENVWSSEKVEPDHLTNLQILARAASKE